MRARVPTITNVVQLHRRLRRRAKFGCAPAQEWRAASHPEARRSLPATGKLLSPYVPLESRDRRRVHRPPLATRADAERPGKVDPGVGRRMIRRLRFWATQTFAVSAVFVAGPTKCAGRAAAWQDILEGREEAVWASPGADGVGAHRAGILGYPKKLGGKPSSNRPEQGTKANSPVVAF